MLYFHPFNFYRKGRHAKIRIFVPILLLVFLAGQASLAMPAAAQSDIQVISDAASLTFPDSLVFNAEFEGAMLRQARARTAARRTVASESFMAVRTMSSLSIGPPPSS